MRTIERDIVGGFILSAEGKILLGHNKKGGVYQGYLVVPGGGIENKESKLEALAREIREETGIDISTATEIKSMPDVSYGESLKTLHDTGEQVLVKMNFYDYKIQLAEKSTDISLEFEDDYEQASWYTAKELIHENISPAAKATLTKLEFIQE